MNTSGLSEVITLIHIVKEIVKIIHPKEKELIVVGSDHLKFIKRSLSTFDKTSQGAAEEVSPIVEIKQLMKSVKTEISIKYMKGYTKVKKFEDNPLPFLINQCHNKVEIIRIKLEVGKIQPNLSQFGSYATFYKEWICNRAISEQVRIIDAI